MTPYEIKVAIHYATCLCEYPESPILGRTIDKFVEQGLLVREGRPTDDLLHRPTDRLRAYVDFLQSVPLPVAKCELPEVSKSRLPVSVES